MGDLGGIGIYRLNCTNPKCRKPILAVNKALTYCGGCWEYVIINVEVDTKDWGDDGEDN